jgi:GTPase SAR1 family protein
MAHLFNLDPAADTEPDPLNANQEGKEGKPKKDILKFSPSKDIKELITVDEVMEEMGLGPNGGLVYALELLLEHREWLDDDLSQYEEEFLVVDCPGQIELYSLHDIFPKILGIFTQHGYRVCVIYLMESQFMQDASKFFAGLLHAASTMLQLGVPHINLISKMDLLAQTMDIEEKDAQFEDICEDYHPLHSFFFPDPTMLLDRLSKNTPPKFKALNEALVQLVDDFDVVNFVPLDVRQEECLERIMILIDSATQYSEMLEPKEPVEYDQNQEQSDEENDYGGQYSHAENEDDDEESLEAVSDELENID